MHRDSTSTGGTDAPLCSLCAARTSRHSGSLTCCSGTDAAAFAQVLHLSVADDLRTFSILLVGHEDVSRCSRRCTCGTASYQNSDHTFLRDHYSDTMPCSAVFSKHILAQDTANDSHCAGCGAAVSRPARTEWIARATRPRSDDASGERERMLSACSVDLANVESSGVPVSRVGIAEGVVKSGPVGKDRRASARHVYR